MSTEEYKYSEIDGVQYVCEMMPALTANTVLLKLIELVGRPALVVAAEAFEEMESSPGTPSVDVAALVRLGVEQVFARLTPEQGSMVLLLGLQGVRYKGGDPSKDLSHDSVFNRHFRGRLLSAYRVWAWSMKCNYQDFFDAARSNGAVSHLLNVGAGVLSKVSTSTLGFPASATMDKVE